MILTADYHTHTKYSHGKGKVLDNAFSAKEKGLKEIAISDHGFGHPAFGLTKRKIPALKKDCLLASEETGVKVLVGVESNILSIDSKTDLPTKLYDDFDVYLAGLHKFVKYKFTDIFRLFLPNFLTDVFDAKPSKDLVKATTNAYINVIEKNPVDAITHLNFCVYADPVEVAKCARDNGVYIELNAKKTHLSAEELLAVADTGVRFIISSDAHSPDRVGEISLVENLLKGINFPMDRIDNIDGRLPNFRFKAFKEGVK